MINVEVTKGAAENNGSLLKKFTRRVQGAGILPRVRSIRYSKRGESRYTRKKRTLKVLNRRSEAELMAKLGKTLQTK